MPTAALEVWSTYLQYEEAWLHLLLLQLVLTHERLALGAQLYMLLLGSLRHLCEYGKMDHSQGLTPLVFLIFFLSVPNVFPISVSLS
jgi:hypothetical protein